MGFFFIKIQNKAYSSTLANQREHSGASAHLQRANARLGVLIWHSHTIGEHLESMFFKISAHLRAGIPD